MKANEAAWTTSSLDTYLADPRGDIHGIKMFFKGLPAAKDRADVIAYLETLKKGTGLILLRHNNRTGRTMV